MGTVLSLDRFRVSIEHFCMILNDVFRDILDFGRHTHFCLGFIALLRIDLGVLAFTVGTELHVRRHAFFARDIVYCYQFYVGAVLLLFRFYL